jgi:hypothetical protein
MAIIMLLCTIFLDDPNRGRMVRLVRVEVTRRDSEANMAKTEETTVEGARFAVPGADFWRAKMGEHIERLGTAYAEFERLEKERAEKSMAFFDASAKLFKDSLTYSERLGAEWRRLSLDAARESVRSIG